MKYMLQLDIYADKRGISHIRKCLYSLACFVFKRTLNLCSRAKTTTETSIYFYADLGLAYSQKW